MPLKNRHWSAGDSDDDPLETANSGADAHLTK
jgi:hypothetical protein